MLTLSRIELFHSGVGDGNDLLVKNAEEVLIHEEIRWMPCISGFSQEVLNLYPAQSFSYSIVANGHKSTLNYPQYPSYQITEYAKRIADFRVDASITRDDDFTYKIIAAVQGGGNIEHEFSGSVLFRDGNKKISESTVAQMMAEFLSGETIESYSVSCESSTVTVSLCASDGSTPDQIDIDAGNVYVFASTIKITEWSITEKLSDRKIERDRTYTAKNGVVKIPLNDFVPVTKRNTFANNYASLLDIPTVSRTTTAINSDGVELLNNEPRLEKSTLDQGMLMDSTVGDTAYISGTYLGDSGTVDIFFELLQINSTTDQYLFDSGNTKLFVRNGIITLQCGAEQISNTEAIFEDVLHRASFKWSASGITLLIDGAIIGNVDTAPAFDGYAYIGCKSDSTCQLDGLIDDLHISSVERDDEDLASDAPSDIDENTTYKTTFEYCPWYYHFIIDDVQFYPPIHYEFENLTSDSNISIYIDGFEGISPCQYDSIGGNDSDDKAIIINVPNNSYNVLEHPVEEIVVEDEEIQIEISATLTNCIVEAVKISDETRPDHESLPDWNNAIFFWNHQRETGETSPPNAIESTLQNSILICKIPTILTKEEQWISSPILMDGTVNGAIDGYQIRDYVALLPYFNEPPDIIIDDYEITKISVDGDTDGDKYNALTIEIVGDEIHASSTYIEQSTLGTRINIPIMDQVQIFFASISGEIKVGTYQKIGNVDLIDPKYIAICYNPSIDMRVVEGISTFDVYAKRKSTELDKWSPMIRRGYYYLNEEEYFLPAKSVKEHFDVIEAGKEIYLRPAQQDGSPVVAIRHESDGSVTVLRQVVNSAYEEKFISDGYNNIWLQYSDVVITKLKLNGIESPLNITVTKNKINEIFPSGTIVEISYILNNSFEVYKSGDYIRVVFAQDHLDVDIYYEGENTVPYYYASEISLNPLYNNNHNGFIYLCDRKYNPVRMNIHATPSTIPADGYSFSRIIAELLDEYGNPVPKCSVSITGPNIISDDTVETDQGGMCSFLIRASDNPSTITYIIQCNTPVVIEKTADVRMV